MIFSNLIEKIKERFPEIDTTASPPVAEVAEFIMNYLAENGAPSEIMGMI
jgi:hypothetical protein